MALSNQDDEKLDKVYNKVRLNYSFKLVYLELTDLQTTETFPWLAHYDKYWPVSVCLQGKLHNSTARALDKSARKAISIIAGVAPRRASKKVQKKPKKK